MTAQEYAAKRLALHRELEQLQYKIGCLDEEYYNTTEKPFPIGTKIRLTLQNTPNTFCPGSVKEGDSYTREGYIHGWELNHDNGEFRPDILSKGGKRQHYYFYHPILKMERIQ